MESFELVLVVHQEEERINSSDETEYTVALQPVGVGSQGEITLTSIDVEVSQFFTTGQSYDALITLRPAPPIPAVPATALLTFTGTALTDADTVVVGTRTYTFKTVLTGAANEVLIGAVTESLTNLKNAVNGGAGVGVTYGTGTTTHVDVLAGALTGTTELAFEVIEAGGAGNLIAKDEASTNLSWDQGATFSGGEDAS